MHLFCAALLLGTILTGCAPSFEEQFFSVEPGQNRDAVMRLLGEPDRADWFVFVGMIMGPPEVLQGVVSDSTTVEELTWTRPADMSVDSVVFQLYLDEGGRVLASTHHSVGAVF